VSALPTVFAVVNSTYADDEVHALYKTRELAAEDARRKGGMWTVAEWTVNDETNVPSHEMCSTCGRLSHCAPSGADHPCSCVAVHP
jgi:hypothetical protein